MDFKLTDKEKLVLWGLVEHPELNDVELSKKLEVKRRTFSAIKTKLKNNGVFSTLIVPDFNMLGCEILTVSYGNFNPGLTFEDRKKDAEKVMGCEETVYVGTTGREYLVLSISKNFTDFRKKSNAIGIAYVQKNFVEDMHDVHFSFEISSPQFFGFSGLIKMLFNLDVECEKKYESKRESVKLTKNEKKALYALVKMPDAKTEEITSKTGIPDHTLFRIKKKLLDEGIIKIIKIPNFAFLGCCELMALIHTEYKLDKRNGFSHTPEDIFRVSSDFESVSLSLFKNYTDYRNYYDQKLEYLRKNDLIDKEPDVLLFSMQNFTQFKGVSFAPLVKKLLEVDAEF